MCIHVFKNSPKHKRPLLTRTNQKRLLGCYLIAVHLNNLRTDKEGKNDHMNVVLQSILRIPPTESGGATTIFL